MRWLRWLRVAAPAALAAPAASPAFNILFIGLLGPHTAYSTSNWSSGCAGCVGCAQLHQLRWLRLLRHLRSIYCSLGFWGPILPIVLRIGALAALPEIGPAARSCVDGTDARSCVFKTVTFTLRACFFPRHGFKLAGLSCKILGIRSHLHAFIIEAVFIVESIWKPTILARGRFMPIARHYERIVCVPEVTSLCTNQWRRLFSLASLVMSN